MRKYLLLIAILCTTTAVRGQTVTCQATAGQWGPCPLNASVQLFTTQSATGTATATAQKVYNFSMSGDLIATWAGITGSPAGCTLQIKSGDSLGNLINNGSAVSVTPANGTTSTQFIAASGQQTGDQISAVYACTTYPSAGTLSLEFTPYSPVPITSNGAKVDGSGVTQPVSGTVTTTPPANASTNVSQFGGNAVATGTGAGGNGIPRVTISNDSSLAANQSVNVAQVNGGATATAATGVQKVGIVGNAGGAVDAATNAAPPANGIQTVAVAATALPTAATATDTVAPMADKFGRQIVIPFAMRDLIKTAAVQTTNATQTTLLASQASQFADLVSLTITNESATACTVALTDGTTTYKFNVANQQGAGGTFNWTTPIPAASTATAWQVTGCASVTLDYVAEFVLNK